MKIDRLIGILAILLQQQKVTAPYLAERFEVSRRTINRDIEHLCQAGVPVVTLQGQNGGISIMDGYRVDRALLTNGDMRSILAGLRSLDSVAGTNRYQQLMEKLSVESSTALRSNEHIRIDLASWYKTSLTPKIEIFQEAVEHKEEVVFCYYAPQGEGERRIEPYLLIFQWSSWYIWGYCSERRDFRMFKLNRMIDVRRTGRRFEAREVPELSIGPRSGLKAANIQVKALFEPQMKWRLIEEYGIESFVRQPDGKLLFSFDFMDKNSLFTWLLSFRDQVRLVEPAELKDEFREVVENILNNCRT